MPEDFHKWETWWQKPLIFCFYWLHLWFFFLSWPNFVSLSPHAQTSDSSFCSLMFPFCAVVPSFFCDNFPSSLSYPPVSLSSPVDSVPFLTSACQPFLSLQVSVCTGWISALLCMGLCIIPFLGYSLFLSFSESTCRPKQVSRLPVCVNEDSVA